MSSDITKKIFKYVCQGLFNDHKLMFSFIISVRVLQNLGKISLAEWNFLLKEIYGSEIDSKLINPLPNLISENNWKRA